MSYRSVSHVQRVLFPVDSIDNDENEQPNAREMHCGGLVSFVKSGSKRKRQRQTRDRKPKEKRSRSCHLSVLTDPNSSRSVQPNERNYENIRIMQHCFLDIPPQIASNYKVGARKKRKNRHHNVISVLASTGGGRACTEKKLINNGSVVSCTNTVTRESADVNIAHDPLSKTEASALASLETRSKRNTNYGGMLASLVTRDSEIIGTIRPPNARRQDRKMSMLDHHERACAMSKQFLTRHLLSSALLSSEGSISSSNGSSSTAELPETISPLQQQQRKNRRQKPNSLLRANSNATESQGATAGFRNRRPFHKPSKKVPSTENALSARNNKGKKPIQKEVDQTLVNKASTEMGPNSSTKEMMSVTDNISVDQAYTGETDGDDKETLPSRSIIESGDVSVPNETPSENQGNISDVAELAKNGPKSSLGMTHDIESPPRSTDFIDCITAEQAEMADEKSASLAQPVSPFASAALQPVRAVKQSSKANPTHLLTSVDLGLFIHPKTVADNDSLLNSLFQSEVGHSTIGSETQASTARQTSGPGSRVLAVEFPSPIPQTQTSVLNNDEQKKPSSIEHRRRSCRTQIKTNRLTISWDKKPVEQTKTNSKVEPTKSSRVERLRPSKPGVYQSGGMKHQNTQSVVVHPKPGDERRRSQSHVKHTISSCVCNRVELSASDIANEKKYEAVDFKHPLTQNNKPGKSTKPPSSLPPVRDKGDVMIATQEEKLPWTQDQVKELAWAHRQVDPISKTFWCDVSEQIQGKSAAECREKWFSLVLTPKCRRKRIPNKQTGNSSNEAPTIPANSRINHGNMSLALPSKPVDKNDDIFNSTPMRKIFLYSSSHDSVPDVGSPIREEPKGVDPATTEYDDVPVLFTEPIIQKAGYKTYLQFIKRGVSKAKKEKNAVTCGEAKKVNTSRTLWEHEDDGDVSMNVLLTPGGTLRVNKLPEVEEEFFAHTACDADEPSDFVD